MLTSRRRNIPVLPQKYRACWCVSSGSETGALAPRGSLCPCAPSAWWLTRYSCVFFEDLWILSKYKVSKGRQERDCGERRLEQRQQREERREL